MSALSNISSRDWKEYNTQLVKRGQILIDPEILATQSQHQQTKKLGRPFKYQKTLILLMLFFKYALKLPYRQTEGFVKELFRQMGISIDLPNFRTLHYRHSRENFHPDHLPDNPEDIPQDFVIVLDSTGIKLTNRGEWLSKKYGNKNSKETWKKKNRYGRRWHVESFFSVFKRWFGEHVSSIKFENIVKELAFKVMIVSMFLSGDVRMLVG